MIDLLALHPFGPLTMSVSEATAHVKELLDDDPTLADLWVRGEVTDARTYASGHTYFSLRDGESQLRCVLFRQKARRRGKPLEPLENGRQYLVRGAVSVYAASGTYQLYVSDHRPLGAGELYLQFEETRARLEAEGLFAPERKRPLPRWPRRIGIATSPHGAVLHDLRQVIGRRFPWPSSSWRPARCRARTPCAASWPACAPWTGPAPTWSWSPAAEAPSRTCGPSTTRPWRGPSPPSRCRW